MLTVKALSGKHEVIVTVHGFDTLTPRAARAALEIAGFHTGEVWTIEPPVKAIPYCEYEGCADLPTTPLQWKEATREMGWDNGDLVEHPDTDEDGNEISYWLDKNGDVVLRSRWGDNPDRPYGYRVYRKSARKLYAEY
jgi:hypothetical protein